MNWNTITLYQFQQIARIKAGTDDTIADVNSKVLAVLLNMTERQIDSMPMTWFIKKSKDLNFLDQPIPKTKPKQVIRANGNRYRFTYDVQQMHFARYIESKEFSKDFIGNMHKASASMIEPMHKFLPMRLKYDATKHQDYAADMQHARFIDVYNAVVFFYPVYRVWMETSKDYLAQKAGVPVEEIADLLKTMDGFIQPK